MSLKVQAKSVQQAVREEPLVHVAKGDVGQGIKLYEGREFSVLTPKNSKAEASFRGSKHFVEVPFGNGKAFMGKETFKAYQQHQQKVAQKKADDAKLGQEFSQFLKSEGMVAVHKALRERRLSELSGD